MISYDPCSTSIHVFLYHNNVLISVMSFLSSLLLSGLHASICLSVYLSFLSFYLLYFSPFVFLSVRLSVYLSVLCFILFICFVFHSICLFCVSFYLSFYLFMFLSVRISVLCLSLFHPPHICPLSVKLICLKWMFNRAWLVKWLLDWAGLAGWDFQAFLFPSFNYIIQSL